MVVLLASAKIACPRKRPWRHRTADEPTTAPVDRQQERLPSTTLYAEYAAIMFASSASDAAAEASQLRLWRVCRRVAAVCAASLLVLVVTYLLMKGPIDSTYDCSPSDPDESGGCPKNFTVGESCELIAPAGPGGSGTCDADGRCICQSIVESLEGIIGLLFGAGVAVVLFVVGCIVAVCCPDRRCWCCSSSCCGKERSAEDEITNLLPGPHVGSSRCSTDQSSTYSPSTDRTSYGSTATTR